MRWLILLVLIFQASVYGATMHGLAWDPPELYPSWFNVYDRPSLSAGSWRLIGTSDGTTFVVPESELNQPAMFFMVTSYYDWFGEVPEVDRPTAKFEKLLPPKLKA